MSWFARRGAAPAASPSQPQPALQFGGPDGGQGSRSLELVRYNTESGKFELGAEALAVLRGTRGPVGVVAVAGRARQGKSFILNQLLGRSGGFEVGPTHRPCTKGLWMWSAPVERTAADGSSYSLVLLDTEGIDAYDQTGQYSTQIFSLAVLLSSLFIYNQISGIDEAALDRLSLVTEMTRHIRVRASDGAAADASELSAFTPSFIWLLRDFYLRLEEDGRAVAPRDYLEAALQPLPGAGAAAKNQIRDSIKALFPDRDCFTLVRPVNDEEALARLDTMPPGSMRPEFREGLARLARLVFQKALPKRLGAQTLTGPVLAGLAEAYVAAINAGAVPTIATAWQGVAEAESRRAADAAEAAYAAAFRGEAAAGDEAALEAAHREALEAGAAAFEGIAIGEEVVKRANERRWRDAAAARFRDFKDKALAAAALACERAINEGMARLTAAARREGATLAELQREAASFEQRYMGDAAAGGPTKLPRFAEFMRTTYSGAVQDLAGRQQERQAAAAASAQQAAAAAGAQAQAATARAAAAEQGATALRARVADLERQLAASAAELARERQEAGGRAAQLAAAQGREGEAQQARQAADLARAQLASVQQQLEAAHAEVRRQATAAAALAAEKDGLAAALQAAAAASAAAEGRAAALQAQLAAQAAAAPPAAPPVAPPAAPAAAPAVPAFSPPAPADEDMDGGGDAEFEAGPSGVVTPAPDFLKMKISEIQDWLTEAGHGAAVWELSQKKGKKADWLALAQRVS